MSSKVKEESTIKLITEDGYNKTRKKVTKIQIQIEKNKKNKNKKVQNEKQ
jgi:Na+/melibiose symporter-like transporter